MFKPNDGQWAMGSFKKSELGLGRSSNFFWNKLGFDLSSNTPEFCVGQQITFSNYFDPPISNLVSSKVIKWTFTGNYVNNYTPGSSSSSTNYFADSTLLNNEAATNWWVSGGSPPVTYEASLAENLTLSGGQQIVVTAKGLFNIFRPSVTMINPAVHGTPMNVWITPWNMADFGDIGLGNVSGPNNMSYYVQVLSPYFQGDAKITQLCTISATALVNVNITNELDNSDPYPNTSIQVLTNSMNPFTGSTNNIIQLDDAPADGWISSFSDTSSFIDYVLFAPTNSGSIYVPLGEITWGTSFGASYPSTNISPNTVTGPIGPDNSQNWPIWTAVFSNPN